MKQLHADKWNIYNARTKQKVAPVHQHCCHARTANALGYPNQTWQKNLFHGNSNTFRIDN